jgi:4-hydroxy-tetrahydrodipicolinate synthase
MDAALHINPYYGKTSRDGLIYHFQAVLDYGPVIAYNVPGRTGQDISDDVIFELAGHPNFAGVKECTGNERIARYTGRGVTCWSGNDDEAHDARYAAGAVGVISVTSNVVPGLMRRLMFDGADAALNDKLQPLMGWLFAQPNPIGAGCAQLCVLLCVCVLTHVCVVFAPCVCVCACVCAVSGLNTALAMLGAAPPVFRLPYSPYGRHAPPLPPSQTHPPFAPPHALTRTLPLLPRHGLAGSCRRTAPTF